MYTYDFKSTNEHFIESIFVEKNQLVILVAGKIGESPCKVRFEIGTINTTSSPSGFEGSSDSAPIPNLKGQ